MANFADAEGLLPPTRLEAFQSDSGCFMAAGIVLGLPTKFLIGRSAKPARWLRAMAGFAVVTKSAQACRMGRRYSSKSVRC